MAKKEKKTKEWKRRQKIIKERQRDIESIQASEARMQQRLEELVKNGERFKIDTSQHKQKLSEIIIDFARPLLDAARNDNEKHQAIAVAMAVWNMSMLPEEEQWGLFNETFKTAANSAPDQKMSEEQKQIISYMLDRKKSLFPDISRMVLDYELINTRDGHHLNVVSTEREVP